MALPSSSSPPSSVLPHLSYMDNEPNLPQLTYSTVNYWKLAMYNYIEANNLISHIDATTKPPPKTVKGENGNSLENPKYKEWLQTDKELCRLMNSTIHVDLRKKLLISLTEKTSAELWNFLIQNVQQIPAMTHPDRVSNEGVKGPNFSRYLPLYEAAAKGNMKGLDDILKKDPTAHKAIITGASETALMVASRKKENHNLVKKLVSLMSKEDLEMQNSFGRTAMFGAAAAGDVESLILMVNISPELPNIRDTDYQLPLHFAAYSGQKDSVKYLLTVTDIKSLNDFTSLTLVQALISGKFYDDCLDLFGRFPKLAVIHVSVLERLAYNHSSFLSGTHFGFWRRKIYYYLPRDQLERPVDYYERMADIENPTKEVDEGTLKRKTNCLSSMFWQLACKYVPKIKRIQEKKVIHTQALQLLRLICSEIAKLDRKAVRDFIGQPLANAAATGNVEVVEEILAAFPNAMFLLDKNKRGVFHIAIANRQANVFNLIYQITSQRQLFLSKQDSSQNTASHLAAYLVVKMDVQATLDLKSSGPGAALHMQRELQWFKAHFQFSLLRGVAKRLIN